MSKLGNEGHNGHFLEMFKSLKDKTVNSASSPTF